MKNRKMAFFILIVSIFLIPGCGGDDKIEVYQAPKEKLDSLSLPANHPDISNAPSEIPPPQKSLLRWKSPQGWEEKPAGNMRLASFSAPGKNGMAEASIVTLPGEAGGLLANVNRWRGQLELPPFSSETELSGSGTLEKKTLSGQEMSWVDFENPASKKRMLTAFFIRAGQSWFFKLNGDSETVGEVQPAFLEFLNQLEWT